MTFPGNIIFCIVTQFPILCMVFKAILRFGAKIGCAEYQIVCETNITFSHRLVANLLEYLHIKNHHAIARFAIVIKQIESNWGAFSAS